jgi:hypothetical protein
MLTKLRESKETRDALLSLLPTGGTMAGIAIGLVSVIQFRPAGGAATFADDILLLAALGFLLVCYAIFFALRIEDAARLARVLGWIDALFIASLTLVVLSGFILVYEFF